MTFVAKEAKMLTKEWQLVKMHVGSGITNQTTIY